MAGDQQRLLCWVKARAGAAIAQEPLVNQEVWADHGWTDRVVLPGACFSSRCVQSWASHV